ncbi:HTH domain-containing protein [Filimonas effusa]|uniref:HTH domain-containing protein n=1 Tax=Filimonas effusa TaxID=2508721 RepID=A0A4Q1D8D1_9BACT|nr:HTH domain-containing protein [Filimonas effusa]
MKRLLKQKENISLEFKKDRNALPANLFETICAMLNREGGDIFLGIDDKGNVKGVEENVVMKLVTDLVNLSNNPQKLDPPFILFPQVHEIDERKVIHIQVPASSQIHKTAKIIYDRSNDGDFKVEQPHRIAEIANRKRNHYTEGIIYPGLRMEDFKQELFIKIRNLIRSNNPAHPWLALDDKQIMEISGLWKKDYLNGQEGFTLASALLLGKDDVIQQIIPHFKIDALVRINNTGRYDDRLYIQTNLIEAYEQLMDFVTRHLPDKFYLEGDQRISLRTTIFREITANLIIHREYTNAAPATFVIYEDRAETENPNNPHGEGPIDPTNFAPFPKNPLIAKFFIQLGRVEELGSGVLTTSRLTKEYAGKGNAEFLEGSTFKTIIPLNFRNTVSSVDTVTDTVNDTVSDTVNDTVKQRLTKIIKELNRQPGLKSKDLAKITGVSEVSIRRDMQRLTLLVEFRGAPKTGGYFLTSYMLSKLDNR